MKKAIIGFLGYLVLGLGYAFAANPNTQTPTNPNTFKFIFSADGATPGSPLRDLPTQGVRLSDGKVIVGLHALPTAARVDCGWYQYNPGNKPVAQSNEVWRVSGYAFDATNGTATAQYACSWRKVPAKTYSKIRLKLAIAELGKLAALEAWLGSFEVKPGYTALAAWNDAQEISDAFEGFAQFREAAKTALGVTEEQCKAVLDAAEVKK